MLKLKRFIALATVAMFLLGLAAPASAASANATTTAASKASIGKDVIGTKYEDATKKLISLGIINGFSDGTVRPNETVTRAQFAAIVAQELGIANVQQSATKFKDVPASHWASGVINVAVGRGIIKGYGDGTFKPDQPVTYAEAYAMLDQMLGYGPALQGTAWPSGVIAKAASLGISKGISGGSSASMIRGDVIRAAANSLDVDIMEQDSWGTDNTYKKQDGKTILSEVFNVTVYNDSYKNGDDDSAKGYLEVSDVPKLDLATLKADEIKFKGDGTKYKVNAPYNPNDFIGQNVEAWVDEDDDVVYYMGSSKDETVYNDTIDKVEDGKIYLKDLDDDYTINSDADVWINLDKEGTFGDAGFTTSDLDGYEDASVKVVLDDNDKVKSMVITDYTDSASGLVKEINASDETIKYYDQNGSTTTKDLQDTDYVVTKDGVPTELSDIKAGDIVNILDGKDADTYFIAATSTQVKGTADINWTNSGDNLTDFTVTINDKDYDVSADATYSDDNNESIDSLDTDDLKDLNGESITVYLDAAGDVRHIVSGAVSGDSGKLIGVVTKEAKYDSFNDEVKFTIVNKSGSELSFDFDPDDVNWDGNEIPGTGTDSWVSNLDLGDEGAATPNLIYVEYKLDSAGKLKDVKPYEPKATDLFENKTVTVNEDDQTVSVDGGDYTVDDNTVIWDLTGDFDSTTADNAEIKDVKTVKWDAIKSKDTLTATVVVNDDKVDYMFVTDAEGSLTSEGNYGVVTGFTTSNGDDAVKLLLPDGTKKTIVYESADVDSYVYNDTASTREMQKGDFIRYELNSDNEIDNYQILAATGKYTDDILDDDAATSYIQNSDYDIESLINGVVTDSSSSSVVVKTKDTPSKRLTTNSETKIFEIYDTDKLRVVSSVDEGSTVVVIDTDDDNKSANYIVVVDDNAQF